MLTLHGGIGMTMDEVRRRYWIPRLRRLVRKVRNQCHGCKRFRLSSYATPSTGVLPTTRTQGINPYQVIGVDYAGPIRYRKRNGRDGKSYVLLYACSLTRGIYIDLLPSLELTDFILSLKRFIARRGGQRSLVETLEPRISPKFEGKASKSGRIKGSSTSCW
jgi:hypothetical protein